ncbi:hypothetical protein HID58_010769 [Brassica napus]|uniref:RNase H type-1 domain-containing protein n=1 Tax=Brassica napus TaxID=3708 RepID=A0ABQ8DWV0_BRANA|nr:hypothetical protein HID58_010769 [Brassica napus]
MALLYISHADETERKARILRVQQGIDESKMEASIRMTKITTVLDKGKGHVFSYKEPSEDDLFCADKRHRSKARLHINEKEDDDTESSASHFSASSEPVFSTGFRLGPSSEGRVSGTQGMSKSSRRRPSSWKRKVSAISNSSSPSLNPLFEEEDVAIVLNTPFNLRVSDAVVWGFSRNGSYDSKSDSSIHSGASWIIRDFRGQPMEHSRRSFIGMKSIIEADLETICWAANDLQTLHWNKVIIEISSPQALEALNNPAKFPGLANLIERTRQALHRFHNCSILVVNSVVNVVAGKIAVSVTNDGRFSSYIARGGPRWLSDIICAEAANSPFSLP